jgi:Fic family protein
VQKERRNRTNRAAVFERILSDVVDNPAASFTFRSFQELLGVPEAAARRILETLVTAGLMAEVERGVWARTWSQVHRRRLANAAASP